MSQCVVVFNDKRHLCAYISTVSPTIGTDISTVSPTGVAIPGSIIGIYLGVPISLIALATLCGVLVCFGFRYSKAKKMLLYTDIGYNVRGKQVV